MQTQIVCFGEMLWDILPHSQMPGGAPMNVAIHLHYNGYQPLLLSRIGQDELGEKLIEFVHSKGLSTEGIQWSQTHLTGVVKANVSDAQEVVYKIVEPVAWDYIHFEDRLRDKVAHSDVFIYGSLAARHSTSRDTLLQYLEVAPLKVMDVNLRPPHYTPGRMEQLLQYADIGKMNHHELTEITGWFTKPGDQRSNMEFLRNRFGLSLLLVTLGENGAALLGEDGYWEQAGFQVEVEDTIGSGDAFLATFLSNYLRQKPMEESLQLACRVGAFVATQQGATPHYGPEHYLSLKPFISTKTSPQ